MQLPFAVIPLIRFTSDRERMGEFANRAWVQGAGLELGGGDPGAEFLAGRAVIGPWMMGAWWRMVLMVPVLAGIVALLAWITFFESAGDSRRSAGRRWRSPRTCRRRCIDVFWCPSTTPRATARRSRTRRPWPVCTARRCTCCTWKKASPALFGRAVVDCRDSLGRGIFPGDRAVAGARRASRRS